MFQLFLQTGCPKSNMPGEEPRSFSEPGQEESCDSFRQAFWELQRLRWENLLLKRARRIEGVSD